MSPPDQTCTPLALARASDEPQLEATDPGELRKVLETAKGAGVDLAVIDTRPSVEADAVQTAALSDFLLIPTRPAILDLRAILGTLDIVKGSARRAAIVLNACPPGRGAGEASLITDARRALKAFGVPVAPMILTQRAAFSHALVGGLAVTEAEPTGKAAAEVLALWKFTQRELFR